MIQFQFIKVIVEFAKKYTCVDAYSRIEDTI